MMQMNRVGAVTAAAVTVLVLACSSSSGGGGGGGFPYSGPSCPTTAPADAGVSAACSKCLSGCYGNSCVTADCGEYFSCYCPCQPGDAACQSGCQSKITQACSSCAEGVAKCIEGCASSCGASSSSSGGGGGSGSSSGSGGVDGGTVIVSCDHSASLLCTMQPVPASNQSAYDNGCSNQGGTPGTICPSAGLLGCCKTPGNEACYYSGGATASQLQMECMTNAGATWSTSP